MVITKNCRKVRGHIPSPTLSPNRTLEPSTISDHHTMFADIQHLQALAFTKTLTPYRFSSSTTIGDHAVNTNGTIPDIVEFGGNT